MSVRDAVIVEAVRTAVGKRNGGLSQVHAVSLSSLVLNALVDRAGVEPATVDDVIWGCVNQVGMQGGNVARLAALAAGWPETVPGTTIDRQCGSSQQSVHFAAAGLTSGQYDICVAGGVEIMSRVPIGSTAANPELGVPGGPEIDARYRESIFLQGVGAEMIADKWGISRAELDEYAAGSHAKMADAIDGGRFASQVVPIPVDGVKVEVDEGLRRGTTAEKLAGLKPAFKQDGRIHAGNSSQISDGAAALLMMTAEKAVQLGLRPIAKVHTAVIAADDPVMMLNAPIPATFKALQRSGLTIDDIGAFEVNEAFASVPIAWLKETGADPGRLNPDGGAIAIGHPLGASGARLMTTLVHHMRHTGTRFGLQTMCEGGGMSNATILELLD